MAESRDLSVDRRRSRNCRFEAAMQSAAACKSRLVVHRQPFSQPGWRVIIGEQDRISPEDGLGRAPPSAGSVQMEYVGQFVLQHKYGPVVVALQRRFVDGWPREYDDNRPWKYGSRSIGGICAVAENYVDGPARCYQLGCQIGVGAFCHRCSVASLLLQRDCEVDSEVWRGNRFPLFVGGYLRTGHP